MREVFYARSSKFRSRETHGSQGAVQDQVSHCVPGLRALRIRKFCICNKDLGSHLKNDPAARNTVGPPYRVSLSRFNERQALAGAKALLHFRTEV